jgi:CubicO group peptidase (beta-lactamase class C family)
VLGTIFEHAAKDSVYRAVERRIAGPIGMQDYAVEDGVLSDVGDYPGGGGYGYLWWLTIDGKHLPGIKVPEGTFSARGVGGQLLLVVPAYDLVIVHRVNTDVPKREVTKPELGKLVGLILDAREDQGAR